MTIHAIYQLSCDEDCFNAFAAPADVLDDPRLLEAAAEAEGWQVRHRSRRAGRRHRCPEHVAALSAGTDHPTTATPGGKP